MIYEQSIPNPFSHLQLLSNSVKIDNGDIYSICNATDTKIANAFVHKDANKHNIVLYQRAMKRIRRIFHRNSSSRGNDRHFVERFYKDKSLCTDSMVGETEIQ